MTEKKAQPLIPINEETLRSYNRLAEETGVPVGQLIGGALWAFLKSFDDGRPYPRQDRLDELAE